jgi:Flp pilus assembly CpaE family ATPase
MDDKPIRALLIEDNPGDARLIREMLADVKIPSFDIKRAERLSAGLECLAEGGIDVVLLDLSLPDSHGLETFASVHAEAPEVPIIVLTGLADTELGVKAVREGAQDYLVKGELNGALLVRSVRYGIERHRARADQLRKAQRGKAGKVLGFMGAKGGAGTTTVALNVASVLAMQKNKVIAAELRSDYGTFSSQLGHTPVANLSHLLELDVRRIDEKELNKQLISWSFGLQVLFGPQEVDEFREIEPDQTKAVIKGLAGMVDYVIVDLPVHDHGVSQAAIGLCDYVVLVVEPEPTSLASSKRALKLLKSWGISEWVVGLVVVNRTMLAVPLAEIGSRVGCEIVGVVPPAVEGCIAAQKSGVPLVVHQPGNMAAGSLIDIANRLIADVPPARGSW